MGLLSFAFNTEWVSVHLYPEGIVYSFNRIITAYLGYTNQIVTPFAVFDYSPYALLTTQNKLSLLGCSKVTRLTMIHLRYTYHSFLANPPERFTNSVCSFPPQKTSSFRFFLTDAAYFTYCERSFVVLRASHPIVANDAGRSRKPMAVHRVKFI